MSNANADVTAIALPVLSYRQAKKARNENKFVAVILMDLSKASDCLPHDLLLLKMKAYGFSENALKLIKSYLSNRKQCVKIGNFISNFKEIYKGVPKAKF